MRYHRSTDVVWELIDGRAVILDGHGATLTTLNLVGTLIWRQLDEPRAAAELSDHLARTFPDVARHQLDADADSFLARLAGDGLVVAA